MAFFAIAVPGDGQQRRSEGSMSDQQDSGHLEEIRASRDDANTGLSTGKVGKPSTHCPTAGALAAFRGSFARLQGLDAPGRCSVEGGRRLFQVEPQALLERPERGVGQHPAHRARLEHARAAREDADRFVDRLAIGALAMEMGTGIS